MIGDCLEQVRKQRPLIHCLTNYVTINDVANILLASGASPIMADDPLEVEEITAISQGLTLNLGTLHQEMMKSMRLAAKKAQQLQHVMVLDPVGIGVSTMRRQFACELLETFHFTAVRGNMSEIKALANVHSQAHGVDVSVTDQVTASHLDEAIALVKSLAKQIRSIVIASGALDLVSDGQTCYIVTNGRPEMAQISGSGCQLSALLCGFLAANPHTPLEAALAAVTCMGVAGEKAYRPETGNSSYRHHLIDAISLMKSETLNEEARYEVR